MVSAFIMRHLAVREFKPQTAERTTVGPVSYLNSRVGSPVPLTRGPRQPSMRWPLTLIAESESSLHTHANTHTHTHTHTHKDVSE